ncbi:hypothetical protein LAZ37_01510 [Vibrio alginolyticus]|nr:hypothetical protein [Vibrio alginolyticus]
MLIQYKSREPVLTCVFMSVRKTASTSSSLSISQSSKEGKDGKGKKQLSRLCRACGQFRTGRLPQRCRFCLAGSSKLRS